MARRQNRLLSARSKKTIQLSVVCLAVLFGSILTFRVVHAQNLPSVGAEVEKVSPSLVKKNIPKIIINPTRLQISAGSDEWGTAAVVYATSALQVSSQKPHVQQIRLRWAYIDSQKRYGVKRAMLQYFNTRPPASQTDWKNPPGLISQLEVNPIPTPSSSYKNLTFQIFMPTLSFIAFDNYLRIVPLTKEGELPAGLMPSNIVEAALVDIH